MLRLRRRFKFAVGFSVSPSFHFLKDKNEFLEAGIKLQEMKLKGHHDIQKNWDLLLSIESAVIFGKHARILDAGSGSKAVFAKSMLDLGIKEIYACDFQKAEIKGVDSSVQDISETNYQDEFFDFIACHSVIEHGVDLGEFLKEMFRITKSGGALALSTDFWPVEEDHSNKYPYGLDQPPMKLFNNKSFAELLLLASSIGWKVPQFDGIEEFSPRPVEWPRMNSEYTFIWTLINKPN
jgi:ubiquinone/menaquinone biosynthesis C-methylase UbiE